MITDKIKTLFNFIEFLHSNIDNFNKYNNLINELELLNIERQKLNPERNYKDKLKYNEVQTELENKFKILQDNTATKIKAKAKKLNVCNFDKEPEYSFNGVETEIQQLKDNFSNKDLTEIFKYKNQYIEYRTATHKNFLSLGFFFDELDEINKSLFDYFKDNEQNEFVAFEKEIIIVNSESKAIELYSKGYKEYKFEVNKSYSLPDLSNGIFDLTLQNLVDCGLSKNDTSELLNTKGKYKLQCNEGKFFVSGEEKKVYTGIEFYRKICFDNSKIQFPFNCPDLIPEYFDLALNQFQQEQNKLLGKIYNDSDAFFEFLKTEVDKMQKRIEAQKEYLISHKHHKFESKENDIKVCEAYIQYLNRKKVEVKQPQQTETIKPNEKYKTQYLFKVGLLFAKGKLNKYFTVNSKNITVMNSEYTAPKIAKELGNESYKKWILASINNYTPDKENGNKNIFNSFDMMTKIISHCEAENIPVDTYFKSRLPIE